MSLQTDSLSRVPSVELKPVNSAEGPTSFLPHFVALHRFKQQAFDSLLYGLRFDATGEVSQAALGKTEANRFWEVTI